MATLTGNDADGIGMIAETEHAAKRPLNSFMAFRNFYARILAGYPQKTISKLIVVLWHEDPFKAKWTMMAKAYSLLRGGQDKEEVPLSEFFRLSAPLLGVVAPEHYLQAMGWSVHTSVDNEGVQSTTLLRSFVPSLESFPESLATSIIGVHDLIGNAYRSGMKCSASALCFVDEHASETLSMIVQSAATAAQPMAQVMSEQGNSSMLQGAAVLKHASTQDLPMADHGYAQHFDPAHGQTGRFELAYDPSEAITAIADEGTFDAYRFDECSATAGLVTVIDDDIAFGSVYIDIEV